MADPYARLRAHIERGQQQQGNLAEDFEAAPITFAPPPSKPAKPAARRPKRRPLPEHDDWLQLARAVISQMRVPDYLREEAIQEAALAGWLASGKWSPDGGMSHRTWTWQHMVHGIIDFLRLRLGRLGRRAEWEASLRHLDGPAFPGSFTTLADRLAAPDEVVQIEQKIDLVRLIDDAGLTEQEREIVAAFLKEETLKAAGARWGVTESRACQVRRTALKKLAAAA